MTTKENKSFEIQTEDALLNVTTTQVEHTSASGTIHYKEIVVIIDGKKPVPLFLTKDQAKELINALNQLSKEL